jgi:hypothetical protein
MTRWGGCRNSSKSKLATDFDAIGDGGALFVAFRFDFEDRKIAFVQVGQGVFQSVVQVILQCEFGGRGEHASVYAIGLAIGVLGEEQYLAWSRGNAAGGLVVEPVARSKQGEDEDDRNSDIVLPGTAFVRPEKCAGKNLSKASHANQLECRRR